jgi:predicted nicotinamide N-methyase
MELGCGTGLFGMAVAATADLTKVISVTMTDFNQTVLNTVSDNVKANQSALRLPCHVHRLDWFDYHENCNEDSHGTNISNMDRQSFQTILGADVVYSQQHSLSIPRVVDYYLAVDGNFHCIIPLRPQYHEEVQLLMSEMLAVTGFRLLGQMDMWAADVDDNDNNINIRNHNKEEEDYCDDDDRMCRKGVWYRWLHYRRFSD